VTMTLAGLELWAIILPRFRGARAWSDQFRHAHPDSRGRILKSYEQRIRKTAERLASQGLPFIPPPIPDAVRRARYLAEITGGRVRKSINDPAQGVRPRPRSCAAPTR